MLFPRLAKRFVFGTVLVFLALVMLNTTVRLAL